MQQLSRLFFFLGEIVALPQLKWEKFTEAYQQTNVKEMTEMGGLSILQTSNVTDPGTSYDMWTLKTVTDKDTCVVPRKHRTGYLLTAKREIHISDGKI